jgi:hypothetical protein
VPFWTVPTAGWPSTSTLPSTTWVPAGTVKAAVALVTGPTLPGWSWARTSVRPPGSTTRRLAVIPLSVAQGVLDRTMSPRSTCSPSATSKSTQREPRSVVSQSRYRPAVARSTVRALSSTG